MGIADVAMLAGLAAIAEGRLHEGVALGVHRRLGTMLSRPQRDQFGRWLTIARDALDADQMHRAEAEGAAVEVDDLLKRTRDSLQLGGSQ